MSVIETRKVQLTGGATYIISIPKAWAEQAGLKPGSEVQIVPQDRYSLLLYTSASPEAAKLSETTVTVAPKTPVEDVVRDFITQYLAGFDIIHLELINVPVDQRIPLKESIRRLLIGAEVIGETADRVSIQCFLGQTTLPLLSALDRMGTLVQSMQKDAIQALLEGNQRLAEEVVQRDTEVDRFYFYIVRQLTAAVSRSDRIKKMGLASPRACLGYRLVVKSMERAGDHASRVAALAIDTKLSTRSALANTMMKLNDLAESIFQDSLRALRRLDVSLAHKTIRQVSDATELAEKGIRQLLTGKLPAESELNLRLAIESLRRIAEYGADIAETSINLAAEA